MNQIPDEIIDAIVQYVTEPANLAKLLQTCKRMQIIVNSSIIWLYLCKRHIFADVIVARQNKNKFSWKQNFENIEGIYSINIKSHKYADGEMIYLRGNGKLEFNIFDPEVNILDSYKIIDFSAYQLRMMVLTSDNKVFEFIIPSAIYCDVWKPILVTLPLGIILKLISVKSFNFVIIKPKKGNNKLCVWPPMSHVNDFDRCQPIVVKLTEKYNVLDVTSDNQNVSISYQNEDTTISYFVTSCLNIIAELYH